MQNEIAGRLRSYEPYDPNSPPDPGVMVHDWNAAVADAASAAAEIERLEAENARLREALGGIEAVYRDWYDNRIWGHQAMMIIAGRLPTLTQPGGE